MKNSLKKERLDLILVSRGLALTREKAQAYILAGQVLSEDQVLNKPGVKYNVDISLRLRGSVDGYVSRGAYKLKHALENFKISLEGKTCLDVGASTGGFTQVCLENGAVKVHALDVGHNQLDWKLRSDARVVNYEKVNIRTLTEDFLPEKVDFICIDTSFISLKLVIPSSVNFLKPMGSLVALIKPQHEVGRENVGKKGIVKDGDLHRRVVDEIEAFCRNLNLDVHGVIDSPIHGSTGNKEFLIYVSKKQK